MKRHFVTSVSVSAGIEFGPNQQKPHLSMPIFGVSLMCRCDIVAQTILGARAVHAALAARDVLASCIGDARIICDGAPRPPNLCDSLSHLGQCLRAHS